jgi:hypothetical protein
MSNTKSTAAVVALQKIDPAPEFLPTHTFSSNTVSSVTAAKLAAVERLICAERSKGAQKRSVKIKREQATTPATTKSTAAVVALQKIDPAPEFLPTHAFSSVTAAKLAAVERQVYIAHNRGATQKDIIFFRIKILHPNTDLSFLTARFFVVAGNDNSEAKEVERKAITAIKKAIRTHSLLKIVDDELDSLAGAVLLRLCNTHDFFITPTPNLREYIKSHFIKSTSGTIRADIESYINHALSTDRAAHVDENAHKSLDEVVEAEDGEHKSMLEADICYKNWTQEAVEPTENVRALSKAHFLIEVLSDDPRELHERKKIVRKRGALEKLRVVFMGSGGRSVNYGTLKKLTEECDSDYV